MVGGGGGGGGGVLDPHHPDELPPDDPHHPEEEEEEVVIDDDSHVEGIGEEALFSSIGAELNNTGCIMFVVFCTIQLLAYWYSCWNTNDRGQFTQ